jgi:CheY-like chemotaxis protein
MALVLVVDDSITARAYCRKVLGPAGHELLEAVSGRDALAKIADRRPDCVVLDLLMPDMSGIELLEALGDRGDRPPVVVLTADIQESVREQCAGLGVSAFINKPAAPAALQGAVAEAVARRGGRP